MKRSVEVPAYSGAAIDVTSGEVVRLVDIEGCQIGDLFAVVKGDPNEF